MKYKYLLLALAIFVMSVLYSILLITCESCNGRGERVVKEVKKWNNNPRYMWVWNGANFDTNKRKEFVVFRHSIGTMSPVITVNRSTGETAWYENCAEIDKAEIDLAEEERLDRLLADELERAEQTCKKDYVRAELSLERVTIVIQQRYPSLVATMAGGELVYVDVNNSLDEYYSLDDIKERYRG